MTYDKLKLALGSMVGYSFAHYSWSNAPSGDYGTFGEYMSNDLRGGNKHVEKLLTVYIDYFTRDDSGKPKKDIETVLDSVGCPWGLESIQYEEQTGYIHYEWSCEVVE